MTRKTYQAIANALNETVEDNHLRALLFIRLASILAPANPRFNRDRWMEADRATPGRRPQPMLTSTGD